MVKTCRLLSQIDSIPNLVVKSGESVIIGRNRQCRIRDIKCSRNYCSVCFDGQTLSVDYNKANDTISLSNGQLLTGPGFEYKVVFVHQNDSPNELETNSSNGQLLTESTDDKQFSYEELVTPLVKKPKNTSSQTEWLTLCSDHIHVCKFLGGGQSSPSIAAFDFDGTLVDTKSGNNFAANKNDWKLFDKSLPKRMNKLIEEGFRFVIISNQLPISQGRYKLEEIQYRFEAALNEIGVPCLVLIAAYDDIYRKPRPGLWRILIDAFNDQLIDIKTSFYVGDAAGRKKQLNGKSDHSSVDLLFAANSKIPFLTPERFFSNIRMPKTWDSTKTTYSGLNITTFRPRKGDSSYIATKLGSDKRYENLSDLLANYSGKPHVIVMCGLSACGKTSFYTNHLKDLNYFHISRDSLKTMEKCHKVCEHQLKSGQNCVIDNTNVDSSSRKKWVDICHKLNAIPILFHFDINVELALHNNKFRRIIGVNSPVTHLVIRSQNKNFEKPSVSEGFESIFIMNFVPQFAEEEHQSIYFMYLSER